MKCVLVGMAFKGPVKGNNLIIWLSAYIGTENTASDTLIFEMNGP